MAWVTTIGPDPTGAQVEYRLSESHGCDGGKVTAPGESEGSGGDAQVDYRMVGERPLEWIGKGLGDLGITDGDAFAEGDKDRARALMSGRHPQTGEQLVAPKVAIDPRGKLPTAVLVQAVEEAAAERGVEPAEVLYGGQKVRKTLTRLQRQVVARGAAHATRLRDIEAVATAAGLGLETLYGEEAVAEARVFADRHVQVGNRGYDLLLEVNKSASVVYGLLWGAGNTQTAQEIEQIHAACVRETVGAVEDWAAYVLRGQHGDGRAARREDASGLLGWTMMHTSARPVEGESGDPHLHTHVTLANMASAEDSSWSTVAAGGSDLFRHASAADALHKARFRWEMTRRFGVRWDRSERTGAWEVAGVGEELRTVFSRRRTQLVNLVGEKLAEMSTADQRVLVAQLAEGKEPVTETTGSAGADWWRRATASGYDVDAVLAAVLGGGAADADGEERGPRMPSPQEIAAHVFRPEDGLDAHQKEFSRAELLAQVINALPEGVQDLAQAEQLLEDVLALRGLVVQLPDRGAVHRSNHERYTTGTIEWAERTLVRSARSRLDSGSGAIPERRVEMALGVFEAQRRITLSEEQRAVATRLMCGGHGLEAVIGVAGAGKTSIVAAARIGWEAEGLVVAGAATAAVAAANLQAGAGIHSRTLASWLHRIDHGPGLRGVDVLVVDEAAMADDREMARLVTAAEQTGTKVVGLGDPQQLRAVGVGGGFRAIHTLVGGLELQENRRQRDAGDRRDLAQWRTGARTAALKAFADRGRVHATEHPEEALAAMLGVWDERRRRWSNPHERIEELLLLAATNADVDALNDGARALMRAAGELGKERTFRLAGNGELRLAVGDAVRVRRNDYRARAGRGPDLLNGLRAIVSEIAEDGAVTLQWCRDGQLQAASLAPEQVAAGALSHGYAMTVAAAQGLTAEVTFAYGLGCEANTLYPALSRHRGEAHLWLPAAMLEDEETRIRLGEPSSEDERLQRAVAAYGAALERNGGDWMVVEELDGAALTPAVEQAPERWKQRRQGSVPSEQLRERLRQIEQEVSRAEWEAEQLELRAEETPGQRTFTERVAVLHRAEDILGRADEAVGRVEALEKQAHGLEEDNRRDEAVQACIESRGKRRLSALTGQRGRLERDGQAVRKLIAERARQAQDLGEQAQELRTGIETERARAGQYLHYARGGGHAVYGTLREQVAQLHQQLPAMRAQLEEEDRVASRQLRARAGALREQASAHRRTAAALREEAGVRARLSPQQHAVEERARARAAQLRGAVPAQPQGMPPQQVQTPVPSAAPETGMSR